MKKYVKKILILRKRTDEINSEKSKKVLIYIKNKLTDSDHMYLTVDSLIH